MPKILFWLERKASAWFLRLYRLTLRYQVSNQPPNGFPCIYAFWHRNLLVMTIQRMFDGVVVLVSSSKDGELIAGPLEELGYETVRGSSSRNASQALKEMIKLSRTHSLAITPDGPKGPLYSIQPGVFQIALLGGTPIIPIEVSCRKEWLIKSWDLLRLPKPFSRVTVTYGEPVWVRSKEDFTAAEQAMRDALPDNIPSSFLSR